MNEIDTECVKIKKFSDKSGSYFNDEVWVKLTPSWLLNLNTIFTTKALNSKDYVEQGFERKQADFFNAAYEIWRNVRNEFDENKQNKIIDTSHPLSKGLIGCRVNGEKVDNGKENTSAKSLLLTGELFECVLPEGNICGGECIKSRTVRTMGKNTSVCLYLRLKKGD